MGLLGSIALRGGVAAARQILQLEDRRTKQLTQLALAVDAGLAGQFKAGLQHLEIATTVDTSSQSVARHLGLAEERFVVAFGNYRDIDPLQSAWAAVYLTVICVATGRQGEALHWGRLAYVCSTEAAELVSRQLTDRADGRVGRMRLTSETAEGGVVVAGGLATGWAAAAAGLTIATGVVGLVAVGAAIGATRGIAKGMEMYREHQLKYRDARIEEIGQFVDDIVSLRRSLGDKEISSQ